MSRHLPLILIALFCLGFIAVHASISRQLMSTDMRMHVHIKDRVKKPDFATIKPVRARKSAFFNFMDEYIEKRNIEILALRGRIEANQVDHEELLTLAKQYRIKSDDPAVIRERLVVKVDAIPPSLVLAQAAIESAWGTSRFAVEGNNYFGQWCFRAGCGMVPESRQGGKKHEVRLFQTPQASVNSYMRNLNSHPAYRDLRKTRADLRAASADLNGCALATGLLHYSEKGEHYVEILKQLIRVNKLETDPQGHCAPVMLAEEPEEAPSTATEAPQEMAADDTQSSATPIPSDAPTPAG